MVSIHPIPAFPDRYQPKRLRNYMLIWCSAGKITVVVDDQELIVAPHQVLTITTGQFHYVKDDSGAEGLILSFTLDFFCKDDSDIELIFHNGLFCHFSMNEVITVKNFLGVESCLKRIADELRAKPYQYLLSVHACIKLLLVEINRGKVENGDEIWKPDALFLKFLELVRTNIDRHYSVAHYAGMLATTEAKLNEQAKVHTGSTAQSVIYRLLACEAKRLLMYQNLSVKETAFKLGFQDPFYFSNFFKKHTKLSPKAYQNRYSL